VNGDYCDKNKECESELCTKNKCKDKHNAGDHCDLKQECKSGVCKDKKCQIKYDFDNIFNILVIFFSFIVFVMAFTYWV